MSKKLPAGKTKIWFKAQNVEPISLENEERALKRLHVVCKDTIKDFITTCEQDAALLSTDKLTFNERNCIIFRMGEKKVLQYYVDLTSHLILWLHRVHHSMKC